MFDVFSFNPRLLPYPVKFSGLLWLLIIFIYSGLKGTINLTKNVLLLVGIHFGLSLIAFSAERNEDEFSAQIRMKAMYVAIISLFLISGLMATVEVMAQGGFVENAFFFFIMLLDTTLFVYITYFYFTKYWSFLKRREK